MEKLFSLFIIVVITGIIVPALFAVTIVDNGNPAAVIVIADNASSSAQKAASTLQEYVGKISGARLEIKHEAEVSAGVRILVGRSKSVEALNVHIPAGFTAAMNEEAAVLKTIGNNLVLAGNEDWKYRGTEIAVNLFLDELGCRWFFPGEYGEVVPKMKTITVGNIDRTERPSFRFRNIWYSGWMTVTETSGKKFDKWYGLNNLSALPESLPGDGTVIRLAPPEKYFESHPNIYAINEKGVRVNDMLCLTEPEAVQIAAKTITETFREHPDQLTFGFAPPDGHPMCYCSRCQEEQTWFMGKGYGEPSLSDAWFKFANSVAQEVYKEFPDRWVLTNGYANRVRVPEVIENFSPNLGIQSAKISTCTLHRTGDPRCWSRILYRELFNRWTEKLKCVFIYDYDPGKGLDGLPFPALHSLRYDLPYFKQRNVWGFWTEGNNGWMITHLNYYIRARLMWNVEADVDALVRDYCEKFYGAAADPIETYIWTLEKAVEQTHLHETWGQTLAWKYILTSDVLKRLNSLMEEAVQNAQTPGDKLHVGVLRKVHENMKTYVEMENAVDHGEFRKGAELAESMLKIRDELAEVDPDLLPHTTERYRTHRSTIESHRSLYQSLAEKAGGSEGDLVLMTPIRWEFKTDPEDVGVIYRWYLPNADDPWNTVETTSDWESQGYQDQKGWGYWGKAWYRTGIYVPESAKGRKLTLTIGSLYNEGFWVWVNGVLLANKKRYDSRRQFDLDVTGHIKPGEINHIAVLVNTDMNSRSTRGGIYRRVFMWSPKRIN